MEEKNKKTRITVLNCGVQGCCPTVKILGENVSIIDDYGNKVKMTKKQWDYFVVQYRKMDID
ncbi:MAG: hypothetical protein PWQ56_51 [Patescibacteria group bacterium]|nr:hypothetical protein [Patescibacteria group bacterium]